MAQFRIRDAKVEEVGALEALQERASMMWDDDRPFLLALVRKDASHPYFLAWFGDDALFVRESAWARFAPYAGWGLAALLLLWAILRVRRARRAKRPVSAGAGSRRRATPSP